MCLFYNGLCYPKHIYYIAVCSTPRYVSTSECAALGISVLNQSVLAMAFSVQEKYVAGQEHVFSTAVSAVTGGVCSPANCAVPSHACYTGAFAVYSRNVSVLHVCSTAVCAALRHVSPRAAYDLSLNVSGPQQPVLSQEVSCLQQLVLHLYISVYKCFRFKLIFSHFEFTLLLVLCIFYYLRKSSLYFFFKIIPVAALWMRALGW